METFTQDECRKEWDKLRREICEKIDELDKKTPFEPIEEPLWLKEMMEVKQTIMNTPLWIKE